jgi:hypothetical protein
MPYWIEFHDRGPGCIHAGSASAAELKAAEHGQVRKVWDLPYGASPSLDDERPGDFCHSPETCKGSTSCPRSYACSE